jgi:outer membrane biosynthesis protein TonB
MPLQTLVLATDARVSGLLAQVLAEMELPAEVCSDAGVVRHKLAEQYYSALILDCENELEVSTILQAARKHAGERKVAFVALVGGPGAPATAFRLGADFVLTKPIGMQQAKNTMRTLKLVLEKMPKPTAAEPSARAAAASATAASPTPGTTFQISPALPTAPAAAVPAAEEKISEPELAAPATAPSAPQDVPSAQPVTQPKELRAKKPEKAPIGTESKRPAASKPQDAKPLVVVRSSKPVAVQPSLATFENYGEKKSRGYGWIAVLLVLVALSAGVVFFRDAIPWQSLGPVAHYAQLVGLYKATPDAPVPSPTGPASVVPKPEPGTPTPPPSPAADPNSVATEAPATSDAVTVSEEDMEKLLTQRVEPVIPADQLPSGPVSPVVLQARISKDGAVTDVRLAHGEVQLAPYAMRAVRDWKYQPYLQNGQAVEVQTLITVTFGPQ